MNDDVKETKTFDKAVSKVIDPVILNLFQDLNSLFVRSRNKFGMTRFACILTYEAASLFHRILHLANLPPGYQFDIVFF